MNGFVPVTNPDAARRFYVDLLGFTFLGENEYIVSLQAGASTIIMQKLPELTPAKYTILGWEVEDIRKTVATLSERGVVFERFGWMEQDELGIWKSPEGRVAWFKDPDGNTLSVSQH
jgi:catechol 2,3-dioxygenase-like lactoylglutathione lyase family enzyme